MKTTSFLIIVAIWCSGGCNIQSPKEAEQNTKKLEDTIYKINETVKFHDSEWVVLTVEDLGKTAGVDIFPNRQIVTEGRFIRVKYKFTNISKSPASMMFKLPDLIDSSNRIFTYRPFSSSYMPANANDIGSKQLQPNVPKEFYEFYEVASGATGLKFRTSAISSYDLKKLIDLGL